MFVSTVIRHRTGFAISAPSSILRRSANRSVRSISKRRPLLALGLDSSSFDVPEIEGSVEYYQRELGARFDEENRVATFEISQERLASKTASFLYDRHGWGLFRITGAGALEFLHNKTTNSFTDLSPGEGCDTVFCTAKGRIKDLATTYVRKEAVIVVLSPGKQEELLEELEKFVFPGDNVAFVDMRSETRVFSLYGSSSQALLQLLNVEQEVLDGVYGAHQVFGFNGMPVIVAKGTELDREEGFTLIVDDSVSGDVYKNFIDAGATPIGLREWETLRVLQGRPSQSELSRAQNLFELDLFHAVSLDKGCFLGQESLARVYTRDMIRKRFWGIELPPAAEIKLDEKILFGDKEVGVITSIPVTDLYEERKVALGSLNGKVNKEAVVWDGKEVRVAEWTGFVRSMPYMNFDFPDGKGAPPIASTQSAEPATRDEAKEAKLKAMQERLAAFMEQQKKP